MGRLQKSNARSLRRGNSWSDRSRKRSNVRNAINANTLHPENDPCMQDTQFQPENMKMIMKVENVRPHNEMTANTFSHYASSFYWHGNWPTRRITRWLLWVQDWSFSNPLFLHKRPIFKLDTNKPFSDTNHPIST